MLTLFLLRHAKSSWTDRTLDDHDRPLNERGRAAAPAVGRYMRDNGMAPDTILCSGAWRTRETLGLLLPHLHGDAEIRIEEALYDANGGAELLSRLRSVDGRAACVMLVGHNPAIGELAALLCGHGPGEAMAQMRRKFPTAGLAAIDFQAAAWGEIGESDGTLTSFVQPRGLES